MAKAEIEKMDAKYRNEKGQTSVWPKQGSVIEQSEVLLKLYFVKRKSVLKIKAL
ncbi:hypothetical protein [Vibrio sp. 10N.237.312.B06]|uniref:hypothetical protein n=1 Tax=Vibrio sp. 10N.237.312.B06 TaxID=3229974 RepID=UPI0035509F89